MSEDWRLPRVHKFVKDLNATGDDYTAGDDGKTVSEQEANTVTNEGILQKKVGAALWKKITTMVLDRHKLDAYIKSGEIDPMVVAGATNETPNAPFIKITRR